ncbi:MAG: flippase-like domain-containing protein [Pyrinomonadaceae bacterium]
MHTENLSPPSSSIIENQPEKHTSRNKTLWVFLHVVAFLAGLGVLIALVLKYRDDISSAFAGVGLGFLVLIACNLTRHLMRAASMYRAIDPEKRTFRYRSAVAARLGGETVTLFSAFTGPFLGDATKVMLMKKHIPATYGASAVIIDNILYYTSVIFIILTGVIVLLLTFGSSGSRMNTILLIIVTVVVIVFILFATAILRKTTPFTKVLDLLSRFNIAPGFLVRKRESILNVENNVFQFYHNRPLDFFIVFGISLCVHTVSITEVYFALTFLGFEPTMAKAVIIEGLTKVVNLTNGFIPGNVGVYEGGNALILKTIGYGDSLGDGTAFALVRRGASLCGNLVGVIILFWRGAESGARRLAKNRE